MEKKANVTCGYCKVPFYKLPSKMKSKSGIYFCSRQHQGFGFRKENNIVKSGPTAIRLQKDLKRFTCKWCNKEQKETIKHKTFCDDDCRAKYKENITEKACKFCNVTKPISSFHRATKTIDGFSTRCDNCTSSYWKNWYSTSIEDNRIANNEINRKWSKTPSGKDNLLMKRLRKYGISKEEFSKMIDDCQGFCQICEVKPFEAIDHCHTTGKVRGLLCSSCNLSLGGFKDNVETLQKAINYLLL